MIKEGDLDWMREDIQSPGEKPRFPIRAVLNNRTLSVYEANHYDTIAFAVNLQSIKSIQNYPDDVNSCFVITSDDDKRIVLCSMRGDTSASAPDIKKEWVKQIFFFKEHCQTNFQIHQLEDDEITKIKKHELEQRMMEE